MDHARIDQEPNGGTEASADGGVATDDRTDERDEPYVKRSVRIQEKGAIYRVIIISQYGSLCQSRFQIQTCLRFRVAIERGLELIGNPYSIQQVDDGGKPVQQETKNERNAQPPKTSVT